MAMYCGELRVGDKVKFTGQDCCYFGEIHEVNEVLASKNTAYVNGKSTSHWSISRKDNGEWGSDDRSGSIELISRKGGIMKQLTNFAKKHLDKNVQNFIKCGWMDENLNVTEEGKLAVFADYFDANVEDLGKQAADRVKELEKEEDKNKCSR